MSKRIKYQPGSLVKFKESFPTNPTFDSGGRIIGEHGYGETFEINVGDFGLVLKELEKLMETEDSSFS